MATTTTSYGYGSITITEVQEGSQIWTSSVAPSSPNYTFTVSNLTGDSETSVKVGDIIMYSYYRYTVLSISNDGTTVLTGNRVSIRGATGAASVTYSLIVSNLAIIKDKDGNLSPSSITVTAKSQTGSNAMANYTGRIKIETTTNNSTWTSRINEDASTKTYTIPADTVAIRCSLYLNGGTTTLLDQQTIPVVSDGLDGTNVTITSTSITYQEGTSGTIKPTGTWKTDIQSVAQGNFLWTKTVVNYSDGSSTESYSVARQGSNGINGTSPTVSNTVVEYQQSTNGKTVPTGTWNTTPPTAIAEQFMWTRTTITYSDSATAISYSVSRNGTNGTSISISSTSVTYQKGTSGTVKPTGTWETNVQPVGEGEYLWTKTVVTYSDSSKTESYSVSRNAVNGTNGTSPTVTSTVTEYVQSNNGTTAPTSGWNTSPPSTVTAGWFMWTKITVTYSDNATSISYTVSKNGTNGNNGINTATVYLYKKGTTAPSVPSGNTTYTFSTKKLTGTLDSWSQTIPTTGDGECYVTAAVASSSGTTDTIATGEWSTPIQFNGTNGTNGTDGTNGLNQATIFLYKRGTSVTKPTTSVTYTFSTGALSVEPNSWKRNIPTIDGNPCWVVSATAIGNETTATITGSNWSDPVKLVEDGEDGKDAYTIVLTNENHTFAGNTTSAIASEIECNVIAYKGTTQVASTIGTITGQPIGMTTSLLNNGTVNSAFKVTVTNSMVTMNGILNVPITVDGKTFTKKFTYGLALKGTSGTSENLLMDVYASSLTKVDAFWSRYLSDASNSTITGEFIAEDNLPDPNATHFYRITDSSATTKGRGLCFYAGGTPPFIDGHTYRIGCWVRKHDGSPKINIALGSYGSWMPTQRKIENTEWEWFEVVHTFGETDASKTTQSDTYKRLYFYFYNNNVAGSSLDMCGFRMEEIQTNAGTARNLLLNTEKLTNWGVTNGATISDGIVTFPTVTANSWREIYPAKNFKYDLIKNQYAIFSIKVKGNIGEKCCINLGIGVDTTETAYIRKKFLNQYVYFTGTGEWQTVCSAIPIFDYMFTSGSGTVDFNDCWVTVRIGAVNNYWNGFQTKEPQLSLGITATSWTPAPEDIEEEVSNLRTDLQSQIDEKIQTYYQATAPSWSTATDRVKHNGDLWYCTESDLYTGYEAKNVYRYDSASNTWVEYSATSELFDAVDGKSTIFYGTTSDTFTDVDTGDYLVNSVDGSSYRWNGTQWVKVTDYQTAIDNIEIGGRNLLKDSDVTNTSLTTSLLGGTSTQVIPSGTVITLSVQVDADDVVWASSGNRRIGVASSVVKDGGGNQYIEAWAAMTGRTGNGIDKTFDTSFHGRVKSTYTLQGELPLDKAFNLYTQSVTSGTVKVSRPKLEIGNKATDWTPAPEDVDEAINNIEIGGRNLIRNSANFNKWVVKNGGANGDIWSRSVSGNTSNVNLRPRTWIGTGNLADYYNKTLVVSFEIMSPDWSAIEEGSSNTGLNGLAIQLETANGVPYSSSIGSTGRYFFKRLGDKNYFKTDSDLVNGDWVKITSVPLKIDDTLWNNTTTLIDGYDYFTFSFLLRRNGTISFRKPQIEIGTKATDWTLAPEDVDADIEDARKVATNYLAVDNTGIMVADMNDGEQIPSTATGRNVFIDNDSVDIRNGTTTLASFTGDNTKFYDPIYKKELATFGASGAIIGANSEQRFIIEKDGIKSINDNGATVFSVNSTEGTVVTEAEVAPSGETNFMNTTYVTLDTVGSGFSVDVTFYNKSLTAIIVISDCNSTLKNVKVNSVSGNATLINVGVNMSTYSVVLPPFTFTYGTNKTISYTITASFVNTYGDSYNLTAVETITYNGATTIGLSPLDGECVRTSGNNQEISEFMGLWSKVVYGEIYQSSAYTKAPAMTFGTRGKDAILAPFSVTMGESLYANNDNQLSIGKYNLNNDEFLPLAFAIGNGVNDTDRSNAFNVDWDGNVEIAGDLEVTGKLTAKNFGGNYLPSGRNINNLSKYDTGWWAYARSEVDGTFPVSDTYGTIGHIQGTSDNVAMQIIRSNSQVATSPIMYVRYKMSGTWGAWQRYVSATTSDLTITRVSNNYADATTIGYLQARKKNGFLSLRGNLMLSGTIPNNTAETVIAQISGWNGVSGYLTVAPQNSTYGTLLVCVTADGRLTVGNYSGKTCAGAYRFVFTTPCNDGYE